MDRTPSERLEAAREALNELRKWEPIIREDAYRDCITILEQIRDSPLQCIDPGPEDVAIQRIRVLIELLPDYDD